LALTIRSPAVGDAGP